MVQVSKDFQGAMLFWLCFNCMIQGLNEWRCLDQNGLHMYAPTEYWMESFSYLGSVVEQSAKVAVIEVKRKKLGIASKIRVGSPQERGLWKVPNYIIFLSCHPVWRRDPASSDRAWHHTEGRRRFKLESFNTLHNGLASKRNKIIL